MGHHSLRARHLQRFFRVSPLLSLFGSVGQPLVLAICLAVNLWLALHSSRHSVEGNRAQQAQGEQENKG